MRKVGVVLKAALAVVAWAAVAGPAQAAVVGSTPAPTWQTNGRVVITVISGNTAYLGGKFTSMRPAGAPAGSGEVPRNHVAAIDLTTGALLPWDPNANGLVDAIDVNGGTVYIGGGFTTVGGKSRRKVAAVDATTGAVTSFKAPVDGEVRAIDLSNGRLYLGGAFTTPNPYAAAVDPATGAAIPAWTPQLDGPVNALITTTDGSNHIVIGGAFNTLNGATSYAIGAVDPASGASVTWNWHGPLRWGTHPFDVVAMTADSTGVYAAGTGNGGSFMKFTQSTGDLDYIGGANGNVVGVAVMDGVLYVGGHYTGYCGLVMGNNWCPWVAARAHLLAVDAATGALETWHPAANSALGVYTIAAGAGVVATGGDFTKLGGVVQQGFGEFKE